MLDSVVDVYRGIEEKFGHGFEGLRPCLGAPKVLLGEYVHREYTDALGVWEKHNMLPCSPAQVLATPSRFEAGGALASKHSAHA